MDEKWGSEVAQRQGFVYGAVLLAVAAILSKGLGSVYTIVLQNVIGDHGMGLFQMAYPIYATLLAVATAGFPVAISKLVSERLALNDERGVYQTLRVAFGMLGFGGIIAFCALYFWANEWASLAGDPDAASAIRAIAPALLVVPVMSALRGFFQGYQWMKPTAVSQVIEQLIRVATIIGLSIWLIQAGFQKGTAAAGAAFGAVTGGVAGFVVLLWYWGRFQRQRGRGRTDRHAPSVAVAKRLIYFAFPISLGALVVPFMNNVDVVTVVNLLKHAGESQMQATTEFGLLTGRAFKLMMLPTTLATGIGIAVMPAVSEAFTLGFRDVMSDRIDTAMRLTVLIALPATVGLSLLAAPIDIALFQDAAGASVIAIMAWAVLFASFQTTAAAVLQGAGWVYTPVVNLTVASVLKLLGNLWLVPQFGIQGAAFATVVSYAAATLLNVVAVRKCLGESLRWHTWVTGPAIGSFVMGGFVFALYTQWRNWGGLNVGGRIGIALSSGMMIGLGVLLYTFCLLLTGVVTDQELRAVPRIGPRLAAWCKRFGILRT